MAQLKMQNATSESRVMNDAKKVLAEFFSHIYMYTFFFEKMFQPPHLLSRRSVCKLIAARAYKFLHKSRATPAEFKGSGAKRGAASKMYENAAWHVGRCVCVRKGGRLSGSRSLLPSNGSA